MECVLFQNNYVNLSVLGKWLGVSFIVPKQGKTSQLKRKKINGTALETGSYMAQNSLKSVKQVEAEQRPKEILFQTY